MKKIIFVFILIFSVCTLIGCGKTTLTDDSKHTINYQEKNKKKNIIKEIEKKINHLRLIIQERQQQLYLGSAGEINGTTIIVSIFTNDLTSSFNFLDENDMKVRQDCLENLQLASTYLETEIKKYGVDSKFIYDFNANQDLLYTASFNENLIIETSEKYELQNAYIKEHIKSEDLKKKYNASNIIYFFFFNTPYQNTVKPRTLRHTPDTYIENELVNMYIRFGDIYIAPPSTYAHEILHTFGAQDLYTPSKNINQEYINYLTSIKSNDIMYTVSNSKAITNDFTELDAYYVGLIQESSDQKKWELASSEP